VCRKPAPLRTRGGANAYARMPGGDVKYRFVIDPASLNGPD
jgi:hypothetical protein